MLSAGATWMHAAGKGYRMLSGRHSRPPSTCVLHVKRRGMLGTGALKASHGWTLTCSGPETGVSSARAHAWPRRHGRPLRVHAAERRRRVRRHARAASASARPHRQYRAGTNQNAEQGGAKLSLHGCSPYS